MLIHNGTFNAWYHAVGGYEEGCRRCPGPGAGRLTSEVTPLLEEEQQRHDAGNTSVAGDPPP